MMKDGFQERSWIITQVISRREEIVRSVHRELWHSASSTTRITDVANNWDFWHMGQFAADYRKLFGELPSETLARTS